MLERLAAILRSLPPGRLEAFEEHLNEQIEEEADNGGDLAEDD
jgi:hypothetical protein